MSEQEAKLALIEIGLQEFCERFLPDEALPYLVALWDAVGGCKGLNVTRGEVFGKDVDMREGVA